MITDRARMQNKVSRSMLESPSAWLDLCRLYKIEAAQRLTPPIGVITMVKLCLMWLSL